jgi:AcrR family transcriptional regulator
LLYYFKDKDELLAATLAHLARDLSGRLDIALAGKPMLAPGELLPQVWSLISSADVQPYVTLWIEVAASAARGVEPYRTVGGQIADMFVAWLETRVIVPAEAERNSLAVSMFATITGAELLEAIGRKEMAHLAITQQA